MLNVLFSKDWDTDVFLVMLHAIDLNANLMPSIGAPFGHNLLSKGWGFFLVFIFLGGMGLIP